MRRFFAYITVVVLSFSNVFAQKEKVDSLYKALNNHKFDDSTKVNLLVGIAKLTSNPDTCEELLTKAITLAKHLKYKRGLGDAYIRKGFLEARAGNYEKSIETFYRAEKLFIEVGDYNKTIACHLNAGNNYADLDNYPKAIEEYNKAFVVADSTNDLAKKVGIMNNVATIYYVQGDYVKANEIFVEVVKVLEELGDDEKLGTAYGNIGAIYFVQKDVPNAAKYMEKAYESNKKVDDQKGMGNQHLNLGSLYLENNEPKKGIKYLESGLAHFKKIDYKLGIADCYNNLGAAYSRTGNYKKAIYYYNEGLKIAISVKNLHGQANIYHNIANLNIKLKKYDEAKEYAEKSMKISEELHLIDFLVDIHNVLGDVYEAKGDYQKALFHFQKHMTYKDSLFNEEKHKQIAELETEYETEKKEKEIEILSKEKELSSLKIEKQQADINRKNTIMYSLIGGVILVIILAYVIYNRYQIKQRANKQLEIQNIKISKQNKEIKDSIFYAKRIQEAILLPENSIKNIIDNFFIFYLPKDIVSGDFYWFHALDEKRTLFSVVDCTGHGVPGAFMSIVGYNSLNQSVNEHKLSKPGEVLDKLHELVSSTLHQNKNTEIKDGMDLSLCLLDKESGELQYAGANNPIIIVRNGELEELKTDRTAIGIIKDEGFRYQNQTIQLQKGDLIYLFSDGYADQFGGEKNRRFMKKRFKETLQSIANKDLITQREVLNKTFIDWKGKIEQLDDICVICIKY